jgi:hypothetical protein
MKNKTFQILEFGTFCPFQLILSQKPWEIEEIHQHNPGSSQDIQCKAKTTSTQNEKIFFLSN